MVALHRLVHIFEHQSRWSGFHTPRITDEVVNMRDCCLSQYKYVSTYTGDDDGILARYPTHPLYPRSLALQRRAPLFLASPNG
jgi:hypothetical protein